MWVRAPSPASHFGPLLASGCGTLSFSRPDGAGGRRRRLQTDLPLKKLFQHRAQDLLGLTGDEGASVRSVKALELQAVRRSVDSLIELEREGELYLRHLEFQARDEPDLFLRCLEYDVLLIRQLGLPVVTTILYVDSDGPAEEPAYRLRVAGEVLNEWRFGCVRLGDLDPAEAIASERPGMLALVPLMRRADLSWVERACRGIESSAPQEQQADLLAIVHVLAEQRYTVEQLRRLVGRERIMQSSIWQEAEAKGREEGREEGRAEGREQVLRVERELCREIVRRCHPALLDWAVPVIESCADPEKLKSWVVQAPTLSAEDYHRLLENGQAS